jgi:penicillin-binding protein 1C
MPPIRRLFGRYLDRARSVLDADGRLLRAFATTDGAWRFAVRPDDVDPRYLSMLVAYEDKRFYRHAGVDPLALAPAAWQWAAAGRPGSGASPLTKQTLRLLEPRPRTLASKLVEMLRAAQLEWHHSKEQILAVYLTVAPFGGNLEGIAAASRFYLGKEPAHLTVGEAALLVALPQSPEGTRPDRHPREARVARAKVLARLQAAGVLDADAAAAARREPVPAGGCRRSSGRRIWPSGCGPPIPAAEVHHTSSTAPCRTAWKLSPARRPRPGAGGERRHPGGGDGRPPGRRPRRLGRLLRCRPPGTGRHDPRRPLARLDPQAFHLCGRYRAPGPASRNPDRPRPTRFGDYAPLNFDQRYRGEVTVREALQLSLNIPAVAVLDRLEPARFAGLMADMGAVLRFGPPGRGTGAADGAGGVGLSLWTW